MNFEWSYTKARFFHRSRNALRSVILFDTNDIYLSTSNSYVTVTTNIIINFYKKLYLSETVNELVTMLLKHKTRKMKEHYRYLFLLL